MILSKFFISTMKRQSLGRLPVYSSPSTSRHTLSTLTNNTLSTNNINNNSNNNNNSISNNVDCYISNIHDPYTNLAIEEYLLRSTDPKRYILFLWRNRNCVVVGRNQNPFQECNLQYMNQNNIPLVRRRSGGGAVFHDMGNSIYTIFMPREAFSRKANAELVTKALLQLDIPARVNERHDIVVNNHKVSGSAYKIISARAYHHGTMLIDADTERLKGCLSKKYMDKSGMQSKGVESVPSPVTNLREYSFTIDHQQFCESVLEEFSKEYNHGKIVKPMIINDANILDLPEQVEKTRQELCTWDWIYGQTPEFTYKIDNEFHWGHVNVFIKSKHGIITEVDMTTNSDGAHEHTIVSAMSLALKGCKYSEDAAQDAIDKINLEIPGLINGENMDIVNDLNLWIKNKLV